MSAIDIIKRRLKEERVPDAPDPDEVGEKKKRPREVAFMDVNLCFAPSVMLGCIQHDFPRTSCCAPGLQVHSDLIISIQPLTTT